MAHPENVVTSTEDTKLAITEGETQLKSIIGPDGTVITHTTGSIFAAMKAAAENWDSD